MAEPDEEPDYLSDEFLAQCVGGKDVRPGLTFSREQKRKHELLQKQAEANARHKLLHKARHVIEKETREAGLKKEIGADNKGFQMLSKMGYVPGGSLGPRKDASSITTPISVELKSDRKGLGHLSKQKEQLLRLQERQKQIESQSDPNQFRQRILIDKLAQETQRHLNKAQNTCRNLDLDKGIKFPILKWYWPPVPEQEAEEIEEEESPDAKKPRTIDLEDPESSDDEIPTSTAVINFRENDGDNMTNAEKLKELTNHLRQQYHYCLWCGVKYDDSRDLDINCPGLTKDDH